MGSAEAGGEVRSSGSSSAADWKGVQGGAQQDEARDDTANPRCKAEENDERRGGGDTAIAWKEGAACAAMGFAAEDSGVQIP